MRYAATVYIYGDTMVYDAWVGLLNLLNDLLLVCIVYVRKCWKGRGRNDDG